MGPTLCCRGIDNASYYTLSPDNKRYYYDSTGTGASFNVQNPYVLELVMDSLRYWVKEMHVDGFRFDLASTLCRYKTDFRIDNGFLYAIKQDPLLRKVKLIAEPWDTGYAGYQVGAYPAGWSEWNDRYRDTLRRFWKGDGGQIADLASRISGSSDIFNHNNRNITASVNFITAHDGFCLRDLVSYNTKHNLSNGEDNRDGNNSNWSWNSGVEGESDDPLVMAQRRRRAMGMFTSMLMSFGVPMILAGDELSKTQFGNNNPYCQDNTITWMVWEAINAEDKVMARYARRAIQLRRRLKNVFNRRKFFTGKVQNRKGIKDLTWYTEKGVEFVSSDWQDTARRSIAYDVYGNNRHILVIMNAEVKDKSWKLPPLEEENWTLLIDSRDSFHSKKPLGASQIIIVPGWSVLVFEIKK